MNHKTPVEAFLARLNAMSRPQLVEAMRYLHHRDEDAVDRALEFAAMPVTASAGATITGGGAL